MTMFVRNQGDKVMVRTESVTEAWEALLKKGNCVAIPYRVSLVADAESANQCGIRSTVLERGMLHKVFVLRSDGVELPPFDQCFVPFGGDEG